MGTFKSASRKISRIQDRLKENVDDAVERSAQRITLEAVNNLRLNDTIATKTLIASTGYEKKSSSPNISYTIGSEADHAKYVEFGTGIYNVSSEPKFTFKAPKYVSHSEIRTWIEAKNIRPYSQGMDKRDLSYVIADDIENTGTPRQPYLRPAYISERPNLTRGIIQAVKQSI